MNLRPIIIAIILVISAKTYQDFDPAQVKQFGLLTVTHAQHDDNTIFNQYLERYAEMECRAIMQINVVWNNQKSPEQLGLFNKMNKWKRPVYFVMNRKNLMNNRYKLDPKTQAIVYFSIDDDIRATCDQLTEGFEKWKQIQISGVTPLIGYGTRSYNFKHQFNQFTEQSGQGKQLRTFQWLHIGHSWIPRHYLNLYYMDTWQLRAIRKIVKERNNCDDIAMNMIVNHFYPEFRNIFLKIQISLGSQRGQSDKVTYHPFRNECLKQFVRILGYNPMKPVLASETIMQQFTEEEKYLISMKKRKLNELCLQNKQNTKEEEHEFVQVPSYIYHTNEERMKERDEGWNQIYRKMMVYGAVIAVLIGLALKLKY